MTASSFNTDTDGMHAAYAQQKCAMIFGGTWEITRIINNVGDTFETGVFEFPLMVEGAEVQHGSGASIGFAIPSFGNPDNIELTMAFIEFLRLENAEPIISLLSPIIPSIKGVAPVDNPIAEELNGEHSKHLIGYLDWMWPDEITDEVGTNIPAVMNGTITPEEAAANIQTTYETIIDERAYTYNWWDSWSDEQWAAVTPKTIPASFAE